MLAALLTGAPVAASPTQESLIQDDPLVLRAKDQAEADQIFATFAAIGIDRVRVSLFWDHIAPGRLSQEKPSFPAAGPSSPASYSRVSWAPYDRMVLAAEKTGVGLLFSVTGPGPAWATPGVRCDRAGDFGGCEEGVYQPDPNEFRSFVEAAGTRYSGTYELERPPRPPRPQRPPPEDDDPKLPGIVPMESDEEEKEAPPPPPEPATVLPRVDHWSVWNEPNHPAWLLPIWRNTRPRTASQMVGNTPAHYRKLVDSAYAAFDATGHGRDTILIGETAPRGSKRPGALNAPMPPAEFARELYCLDSRMRPFTGRAARLRGCPDTAASRRTFARDHSGLFRASGWGQHAYSFAEGRWHAPPWRHPLRDNVPIGNLRHLTQTLDRATAKWRPTAPKPIWITEYGYQTSPPDPTAGVAPDRQGPLTAWGEYIAYRNPRVASIAQFLLRDDVPVPGLADDHPGRWVTWQSGIFTSDRRPKPFYEDYIAPLHVIQRGSRARAFGTSRPAPTGMVLDAAVEFAPAAGGPWRTLSRRRVRNSRGYVNLPFSVPSAGRVRLVWTDPVSGGKVASNPAPVSRSGNSG